MPWVDRRARGRATAPDGTSFKSKRTTGRLRFLYRFGTFAPNSRDGNWTPAGPPWDVHVPCAPSIAASPPGPTRTFGPAPTHTPDGGTADGGDAVFAVSWQPAFCETKPNKPECLSMTSDRFDATHLTLHGLWPQGADYCGISAAQKT